MGYAPGRPLNQITCYDIIEAMRSSQGQELITQDDSTRIKVRQTFDQIQGVTQEKASQTTLLELVTVCDAAEKELQAAGTSRS
jgi:DNA-binding IscR family transcriptional regulator